MIGILRNMKPVDKDGVDRTIRAEKELENRAQGDHVGNVRNKKGQAEKALTINAAVYNVRKNQR